MEIYGLNYGDTDALGAAAGYTSLKKWTMVASSDQSTFWDALYLRDPNAQQFWPIWQYFLDNSNGKLNNNGFNFQ